MASPTGALVVDDLDLEVAGGEIVCIAGVQGNGQTELAEALLGVIPVTQRHGDCWTASRSPALSPSRPSTPGWVSCPRTASTTASSASFTVAENLVLNHFDEPPYARGIALDLAKASGPTPSTGSASSTSAPSRSRAPVSSLSGGNQQKVVLARELSRPLSVLIASQPTRGVDVGAIEFLHRRLVDRTRPRHRGADRVDRAGRGRRAGRPDRGDVPRPDRRHRAAGHLPRSARA